MKLKKGIRIAIAIMSVILFIYLISINNGLTINMKSLVNSLIVAGINLLANFKY